MRNAALHHLLEAFTVDASGRLTAELAGGAEMPFEIVEERTAGRVPLYCYRPLSHEFIDGRMGTLSTLSSYRPAVDALATCPALDAYLEEHGAVRIAAEPRAQAVSAGDADARPR